MANSASGLAASPSTLASPAFTTSGKIVFDATGNPSSVSQKWLSSTTLENQVSGTGWNTNRRVVTWNYSTNVGTPFRTASMGFLTGTPLDTPYVSGDDSANYLNYLRGDRSNEKSNSDASKPYRQRALLLGDIVVTQTATGPVYLRDVASVQVGSELRQTSAMARHAFD